MNRGAPPGFYGLAFGLVAVAATIGSLVYGYYYLSLASDWPPAGLPEPSVLPATALTVVAVIAGISATAGLRAARRARPGQARAGFFAATALFGAALAGEAVVVAALPWDIDSHAYAAAFITLHGAVVLVAGAAFVTLAAVAYRLARLGVDREGADMAHIATLLSLFATGTWVLLWFVLYISPALV